MYFFQNPYTGIGKISVEERNGWQEMSQKGSNRTFALIDLRPGTHSSIVDHVYALEHNIPGMLAKESKNVCDCRLKW